jgi:hypothetical protein
MKLIRVGGHPMHRTYQCIDCKSVTTAEDEVRIDSYFEWLMSRTTSKRAAAF